MTHFKVHCPERAVRWQTANGKPVDKLAGQPTCSCRDIPLYSFLFQLHIAFLSSTSSRGLMPDYIPLEPTFSLSRLTLF